MKHKVSNMSLKEKEGLSHVFGRMNQAPNDVGVRSVG
jgi:hypothetical protein